jgi:hypothetical protein
VWAWRRGQGTLIAVNCSDLPVELPIGGEVLVGTARDRDGERPDGPTLLQPWEAVVLAEPGTTR